MSGAAIVGALVAGGVYLILQRGLVRVVLGFILLGHAVNVLLVVAGGIRRRGAPIVGEPGPSADPLPQALALTAIVIGFAVTAFLLALAFRSAAVLDDDDTEAPPG